jgi:hypothetical protein
MIKEESISKEWIEHIAKSGKADKILVEKTIRALILLEGLAMSYRVSTGLTIKIACKPFL